jgi:class 3 adenylate cyclase
LHCFAPVLQRWNAGHPNMEGDSLRVTFKNATIACACAYMLRNVRVAAGFELRISLELGEVSVIHNAVTNQPDIEGTAVSMAASIEASAKPGENTDNR